MEESLTMLSNDKEYILSLDGKQVGTGLKEQGVGDVNLWGFEGPPSLTETLTFLRNETNNILAIADKIDDQEDKTYLDADMLKDLKFVVEALSLRIKGLREAKVRHEILRSSFTKKVTKFPQQGSRYKLAFADIEAFLSRADIVIKDILNLNVEWCNVMARVNRSSQCSALTRQVDLEKQRNFRILLNPDVIEQFNAGLTGTNPEYVKQRTPEWFNMRRCSRITSSTMHNALGLRTLKLQKEHFDEFVLGKMPKEKEPTPAMTHGMKHEVMLFQISK